MSVYRYRNVLIAVLCALMLAVPTAVAQACSLDNIPSLSLNGRLPILNKAVPLNSAQLATYAPFVFPRPYPMRSIITFTENRRDVAKSLQASAMRRPWRWHFGDGAVAYGWTVKHSYKHACNIQVSVDAYDPGTKAWYLFDRAQFRIVS
jgi:hypothetical protein